MKFWRNYTQEKIGSISKDYKIRYTQTEWKIQQISYMKQM